MVEERNGMDFQAVYDRLTRLEEKGTARDERIAAYQAQASAEIKHLEATISALGTKLDVMAGDLRDAKTGLRIGLWISSTLVPAMAAAAGWFAHLLWPVK